ncbi:MAG: uracil-DNA glycosylase [Pseudobdellovibrionaceae bacterium]|nr:uracil-DNA glycosylase [Pseudobdellovibrionaceae bacterium]
MTESAFTSHDLISAVQWYLEIGWDEAVFDVPQNRLLERMVLFEPAVPVVMAPSTQVMGPEAVPLGAAEAQGLIAPLLDSVSSLDDLKQAIAAFDGLAIKKTAANLVFGNGYPQARLMIVGEIPEEEDDRSGQAFAGEAGQLLDKMMAAIGLSRAEAERAKAVYMTYALNWRTPGNRTPNASEIELSAPFLKKHIELVKPDFLLLMGSVPAKALLGRSESMTRLRGQWFEYQGIPALVSFPPSFLLKSPAKKREAWEDLQGLQKRMS